MQPPPRPSPDGPPPGGTPGVDWFLFADGANAGSELRTETSHPGLFRQEVEAVDEIVDEPVSGGRARVLGDVQPNVVEVLFSP